MVFAHRHTAYDRNAQQRLVDASEERTRQFARDQISQFGGVRTICLFVAFHDGYFDLRLALVAVAAAVVI